MKDCTWLWYDVWTDHVHVRTTVGSHRCLSLDVQRWDYAGLKCYWVFMVEDADMMVS